MMLDTLPPGQAATRIIPKAMEGWGRNARVNRKVSAGSRMNWATRPMPGRLVTRASTSRISAPGAGPVATVTTATPRPWSEWADAPPAIDLDCPDNRYVNDAAICRAVATQLAAIGLEVTPRLRPKAEHFAHVRGGRSAFYLLGWGVPTFDSAYIFANLVHSRTANMGTWNGTSFANAELDRQIEALSELSENGRRQGMVDQIWRQLDVERIYVPLHVQTLIYAMRDGIDIAVDISNTPKLKNARTRPRPSQKGPAPR